MDVNEVTVGQFKQFANQSRYEYDGNWNKVAKRSPGDKYPMVLASWHDAVAFMPSGQEKDCPQKRSGSMRPVGA